MTESTEQMIADIAGAGHGGPDGRPLVLMTLRELSQHDEAAFLISPGGVAQALNYGAARISDQLDAVAFGALVRQIHVRVHCGESTFTVEQTAQAGLVHAFVVTLASRVDDERFACFLRDITIEQSIQLALIESRTRYRDFVGLSDILAWETRADGSFDYVSPRGGLGYSADELLAIEPSELFPHRTSDDEQILRSLTPIINAEHWLRAKGDIYVYARISVLPIITLDGIWRGARGVIHDITAERQAAASAADLGRTESFATQLFTIASSPKGEWMHAARAIEDLVCALIPAAGCEIVTARNALAPSRSPSAPVRPEIRDQVLAQLSAGAPMFIKDTGAILVAALNCSARHEVVGHLIVERGATDGAWTASDIALLRCASMAAAAQLGTTADFEKTQS